MEITLRGPEAPVAGDNTFELVAVKDGKQVDDAALTVRVSMPAMPSMNMPEMSKDATLATGGGVGSVGNVSRGPFTCRWPGHG
jgi:hypothetical protein